MSDLRSYKVRLIGVLLLAVGAVLVWADWNAPDLVNCRQLLQQDGMHLLGDVDASVTCDELEFEAVVNASEGIMICAESNNSKTVVIRNESRRGGIPSDGPCSIISQKTEFQSDFE